MFYKREDDNYWEAAEVNLPSGEILTRENRENKDGWIWHDEPPRDFVEFEENKLTSLKMQL